MHTHIPVCLSDCAHLCDCELLTVHLHVQMYVSVCVCVQIDTQAHRYLDSCRFIVYRCVHTSDCEGMLLSKKTDTV